LRILTGADPARQAIVAASITFLRRSRDAASSGVPTVGPAASSTGFPQTAHPFASAMRTALYSAVLAGINQIFDKGTGASE